MEATLKPFGTFKRISSTPNKKLSSSSALAHASWCTILGGFAIIMRAVDVWSVSYLFSIPTLVGGFLLFLFYATRETSDVPIYWLESHGFNWYRQLLFAFTLPFWSACYAIQFQGLNTFAIFTCLPLIGSLLYSQTVLEYHLSVSSDEEYDCITLEEGVQSGPAHVSVHTLLTVFLSLASIQLYELNNLFVLGWMSIVLCLIFPPLLRLFFPPKTYPNTEVFMRGLHSATGAIVLGTLS